MFILFRDTVHNHKSAVDDLTAKKNKNASKVSAEILRDVWMLYPESGDGEREGEGGGGGF